MLRRTMLATLVALALSGCNNDTASPDIDLNGTWSGTVAGTAVSVLLAQNGNQVTGSGTVGSGASALAIAVSGVIRGSDLTATVTSPQRPAVSMTATVTRTEMNGIWNGGDS